MVDSTCGRFKKRLGTHRFQRAGFRKRLVDQKRACCESPHAGSDAYPGATHCLNKFARRMLMTRLLVIGITLLCLFGLAVAQAHKFDAAKFDRDRVLKAANQYLSEAPITITASTSPRSAGGPHDFFSEGDYWWPDPQNPEGPYVQRDGMT